MRRPPASLPLLAAIHCLPAAARATRKNWRLTYPMRDGAWVGGHRDVRIAAATGAFLYSIHAVSAPGHPAGRRAQGNVRTERRGWPSAPESPTDVARPGSLQ